MSKRFTDTEKWNKRFIRGLKPAYKLLWLYLTDSCNHAGIWDVDFDVAKLKIGMPISEQEAIKQFKEKITVFDNGAKWFIPSFIEFQYGELSEMNRAHTKIIFLLKKFNLINEENKPLTSPLTSPLQGGKDMYKEEYKDKEEEKDKGGMGENSNKVTFPFSSENFMYVWGIWINYKKSQFRFEYKDNAGQQAALNKLVRLSNGREDIAIKIIEESISNGWKGFFELKENNNGQQTSNKQTGTRVNPQSAIDRISKMYQPSQE